MRERPPITLTIDDYSKLASLVTSRMARAFSNPAVLHELRGELRRAHLVEPETQPEDVIAMNSTITLRDVRTQASETYTLVYPSQADIKNRRLSVLSPAGVAVLGFRVGEEIRWPVASGQRSMIVEKVVSPAPLEPAAM